VTSAKSFPKQYVVTQLTMLRFFSAGLSLGSALTILILTYSK
jgi:hypothetical protein